MICDFKKLKQERSYPVCVWEGGSGDSGACLAENMPAGGRGTNHTDIKRESILTRGNSKFKGPKVRAHLACLWNCRTTLKAGLG